jgi:hypothetical protein
MDSSATHFYMCWNLGSGNEIWKYEAAEVEMMPSRWTNDGEKSVDYTLDNYYPPLFLDAASIFSTRV